MELKVLGSNLTFPSNYLCDLEVNPLRSLRTEWEYQLPCKVAIKGYIGRVPRRDFINNG